MPTARMCAFPAGVESKNREKSFEPEPFLQRTGQELRGSVVMKEPLASRIN